MNKENYYRKPSIPKCNKKPNHFWSGKIIARINKQKKIIAIERDKDKIPTELFPPYIAILMTVLYFAVVCLGATLAYKTCG